MKDKDAPETRKKEKPRKAADKQAAADDPVKETAPEYITAKDMYALLDVLREGLASRDKVVDLLQY